MSENKKYYWYKMKTDFFEEMIIKFLQKQKKGDTMVLLFQKIMLFSLKNDGYLYYRKMFPTFEEELALAIDAKPNIIKELWEILINFEAVEKVDESTYYIKMLEDCVGSETRDASRKRLQRKNAESGQCPDNVRQCPPEIEKEIEIESDIEKRRTPSSFSDEKKGGRFSKQNNFSNNYPKNKSNSQRKHSSYDLAEIQKIIDNQELVYIPNSQKTE